MSKVALYNGLKTDLLAIPGIKHVALFNNQVQKYEENNSFLCPAVFIQFMPSGYTDLSLGVQQYDLIVRLHIVHETYATDDITLLTLNNSIFSIIHLNQYEKFGRLSRVNEEEDFDHPAIQDHIQDYKTLGKDYAADKRPTNPVTPTLIINS